MSVSLCQTCEFRVVARIGDRFFDTNHPSSDEITRKQWDPKGKRRTLSFAIVPPGLSLSGRIYIAIV